ncbi:MAG: sulfotransferase family 2 domain-containing protein [Bacteroidota bacterium]
MIISHKHKFIFIKTKKTASTSVEIALSNICGSRDVLTPIDSEDEKAREKFTGISAQNYYVPLGQYGRNNFLRSIRKARPLQFYNHMSAREIRNYVSKEVWDNYYKFTIDRNPYDKIVSLYYWRGGDKKFGNIFNFLVNGGLEGFNSYDLYTINGVMVVDRIYRFEKMDEMCEDLTKRLNLEKPFELVDYKAKSTYRNKRNYQSVLDQRSKKLIRRIFAREFELMDYEW